jgi:hypothetical protein
MLGRGLSGIALFFIIGVSSSSPAESILLRVKGQYLAYSYDHNQILGEGIEFVCPSISGKGLHIKTDVSTLACCIRGDVVLNKDGSIHYGDEFYFDLKTGRGTLVCYKGQIETVEIGDQKEKGNLPSPDVLDNIDIDKIRGSLIYFVGREIEIDADSEVFGYQTTVYLEGIESVGFKKINMSKGFKPRTRGFSLDKVWYTNSQGLIVKGSYIYQKKDKIQSLSRLTYEEHSFLEDYQGLERQFDFITSTTFNKNDKLRMGMTGNYNSGGLWDAQLWLTSDWKKSFQTQLDFSYNKQINLNGESWFGLQSSYSSEKYGNLFFLGRYEVQNQLLSSFSYGVQFFQSLGLLASASYSKIKSGWEDIYSEILTGNVSISYSPSFFNLSTDYYLNYDLMGSQFLSQPQVRFGIKPISFYSGLLAINLNNIFIYNNLSRDRLSERSYSNNIAWYLNAQPISIWRSFRLNFSLVVEQFLEKEGRNFTSGGPILRTTQDLGKGISVQALYSAQSRRRTRDWLVEGTASQDLSLSLRLFPSENLSGWISFSFDPKNKEWRYSYANLAVGVIKNWSLHSTANYNFLFKKLENIDLYLIREAGRFQVRFIWRSLSRQFLAELVPR